MCRKPVDDTIFLFICKLLYKVLLLKNMTDFTDQKSSPTLYEKKQKMSDKYMCILCHH